MQAPLGPTSRKIGLSGLPTIVAKSFNPPRRKASGRTAWKAKHPRRSPRIARGPDEGTKGYLKYAESNCLSSTDRCHRMFRLRQGLSRQLHRYGPSVPRRIRRKASNGRKGCQVIDEVQMLFSAAPAWTSADSCAEKAGKPDIFHAITMEKEVVASTGPAIDPALYKGVLCYAEVRHGKLRADHF